MIQTLERLLEQKARPDEVKSYHDDWWDAHKLFVYEAFLYIVAALLKTGAYDVLHTIFATHYVRPESEKYRHSGDFYTFSKFYGYSADIQEALGGLEPGRKYLSTAGELIKRQASRSELPFLEIMQAELLVQFIACINSDEWYPNTLYYAEHFETLPFFIRAARKKDFEKLARIAGADDADELRNSAKAGKEEWDRRRVNAPSFWRLLNVDKWGTL